MNDDGMRLRVRAMLKYMKISEISQPNKGRIHINKTELIEEVKKNGGKINFDVTGYTRFKEEETTSNKFPDVPQRVRARFRPAKPGEGPPGTFIREGGHVEPPQSMLHHGDRDPRHLPSTPRPADSYQQERRESRHSPYPGDDRGPRGDWPQDRTGSYAERNASDKGLDDRRNHERRGHYNDAIRRGHPYDRERESDSRGYNDYNERGRPSDAEMVDRRGGHRDWERRGSVENDRRLVHYDSDRHGDRVEETKRGDALGRSFQRAPSYYDNERHAPQGVEYGRGPTRDHDMTDRRPLSRENDILERSRPSGVAFPEIRCSDPPERVVKRQRQSMQQLTERDAYDEHRLKRTSESALYGTQLGGGGAFSNGMTKQFASTREDPNQYGQGQKNTLDQQMKKRWPDEDQKPAANRGYNIEPAYSRRRST